LNKEGPPSKIKRRGPTAKSNIDTKIALDLVEVLCVKFGDQKALESYRRAYLRRLTVLDLVKKYSGGKNIIDCGAQPFILSCALKYMGYEVVAVDIEPEEYLNIAQYGGVKVIKADLERDNIPFPRNSFDCAVLSEVIEHLNPYYVTHTLAEINRVLKPKGILIVTTPNLAALTHRLMLLLGISPIPKYHVREYTKKEIEKLLKSHGFRILLSKYSDIYDLVFIAGDNVNYRNLHNYAQALVHALRKPHPLTLFRGIVYPLVKLIPSLRMSIICVAEKFQHVEKGRVTRWEA
jgi:2-polyprenyl-3-methyl-5-hydroxy-6-metoxy-1,4-benzoquinol methylase